MADSNRKIYRIQSFDRLKDEFAIKALGFVTYDTWVDKSEGPILRALAFQDGQARVKEWLAKNAHEIGQPDELVAILVNFRKTVHMQSWSAQSENSLMWDAYQHSGREIRISTTREKIAQLGNVEIHRVEYSDIGLKEQLGRVFRHGKIRLAELFLRKKWNFRHEKEIRLITHVDMAWLPESEVLLGAEPSDIRASLQEFIDNGMQTKEEVDKGIAKWIYEHCVTLVPFDNVDGFINSVQVGPRATAEFADEVRAFCDDSKIVFDGKSKLLQFELPPD